MTESLPGNVVDEPLGSLLSERYLSYALSTIMARSLPDVRDGLKPVHRRLIYAMTRLGLLPTGLPRKSARVVGDVIGRYHPHGDAAVYDALVRLAQDFAVRFPLIDGQGNFGNIDGDNAAAMRYTEARLTLVAMALIEGLDEDAVDFRETYDGDGREPTVLPGRFPNLLANGAVGIAVGMATSIPPHNVGEICAALRHLIAHPDAAIADLVAHIPGPDFPTGGILVEDPADILEAYALGRGGFRVRARWHKEELKQGQYEVVVTEIPYAVGKSRLVERIAELLTARKLPLLDDIRDESAEDIRLVLVPKSRNVDATMLMESLYRASDLESRFSLNMNVLDGGQVPRVMNLREVLRAYLDHRHEVLIRRSRHRLGEVERRLELLAGYLIAYLNLDEVIRIIREEDHPKTVMMAQFGLTDTQAEGILNMRLRSLRKLEEIKITEEHAALSAEKAEIEALLADEGKRWEVIDWEIADIAKTFGGETDLGRRRTEIAGAVAAVEVPTEAFVEREPVTVLLSEKGWVRAAKGHGLQAAEAKYKDGDGPGFALPAYTTDKLLVLSSSGRCYTLGVDKLPGGRGFGEPLRLMIDMETEAAIVCLVVHQSDARYLVASNDGRGFVVNSNEMLAQTRSGKQVLNPAAGARALLCTPAEGDHVAVIGENRKLLVFPLAEVPEMARGRGVMLQKYKDGGLADAKVFSLAEGLTWRLGEKTRTETDLAPWLGKRAQTGRLPPTGFPKSNRFA